VTSHGGSEPGAGRPCSYSAYSYSLKFDKTKETYGQSGNSDDKSRAIFAARHINLPGWRAGQCEIAPADRRVDGLLRGGEFFYA
jgi:hypothetical protein